MDINIQAIHFEASEKLQDFIVKKTTKLGKFSDEIRKVEVSLKVVKPETAMNKEVALRLSTGNGELFAAKVSDTFEDALLGAIDAIKVQIEKTRNK